jgi:hypothetical protein
MVIPSTAREGIGVVAYNGFLYAVGGLYYMPTQYVSINSNGTL